MTEKEIQGRAKLIAQAFNGASDIEALNILGIGLNFAHETKAFDLAPILPIWHIAKLVSGANGEKGIVTIKKDGHVAFEIRAGKEKKMSI